MTFEHDFPELWKEFNDAPRIQSTRYVISKEEVKKHCLSKQRVREALMPIINEIKEYGQELRNDWSDFDGREARDKLNVIAKKLEELGL